MISEKESRTIYILKAFAIISVVCAHISLVPETFSQKSKFICILLNEIGAFGVGIFFCVSGYLFSVTANRNKTFKAFIYNKLTKIGIPWIVSATLVYIYVAIRKGGSIVGWLVSVLGYQSSYWFLSMLLIILIAFYFIQKSSKDILWAFFLMVTALISVVLRSKGIIRQDSFGVYLNVFNWGIFFSAGYIYEKKGTKKIRFLNKTVPFVILMLTLVLLLVGLPATGIGKISYFYYFYIPIEMIAILVCIGAAIRLSNKKHRVLEMLGKNSFAIYLYNELLWAGLIVYIGNKFDSCFLLVLRPVIVLCIVLMELLVGDKIFDFLGKKKQYEFLTGVKI